MYILFIGSASSLLHHMDMEPAMLTSHCYLAFWLSQTFNRVVHYIALVTHMGSACNLLLFVCTEPVTPFHPIRESLYSWNLIHYHFGCLGSTCLRNPRDNALHSSGCTYRKCVQPVTLHVHRACYTVSVHPPLYSLKLIHVIFTYVWPQQ